MAFRLRWAPYWVRHVAVIQERTAEHKFLVEVTAAHQRNLDRWIHGPFQCSLSDFQHESNLFAYSRCTVVLCISASLKKMKTKPLACVVCTEGVLRLWYSKKKTFWLVDSDLDVHADAANVYRSATENGVYCLNWVHCNVFFWLALNCNTTSRDENLGGKKMHYNWVTTVV